MNTRGPKQFFCIKNFLFLYIVHSTYNSHWFILNQYHLQWNKYYNIHLAIMGGKWHRFQPRSNSLKSNVLFVECRQWEKFSMTKTFETFLFSSRHDLTFFQSKQKRENEIRGKVARTKDTKNFFVHRAKSLYLSLTLCRVQLIYVRLLARDCARLTSIALSTFFRQNRCFDSANRFTSFCVHSSFRK